MVQVDRETPAYVVEDLIDIDAASFDVAALYRQDEEDLMVMGSSARVAISAALAVPVAVALFFIMHSLVSRDFKARRREGAKDR